MCVVRRPTDNAVRLAIAVRFRAGETVNELVAATGLHRSTVRAILEGHGVTFDPVPQQRRLTVEEKAEIVAAYRPGEPMRPFAARVGVGSRTARLILASAGVRTLRRGQRPERAA